MPSTWNSWESSMQIVETSEGDWVAATKNLLKLRLQIAKDWRLLVPSLPRVLNIASWCFVSPEPKSVQLIVSSLKHFRLPSSCNSLIELRQMSKPGTVLRDAMLPIPSGLLFVVGCLKSMFVECSNTSNETNC